MFIKFAHWSGVIDYIRSTIRRELRSDVDGLQKQLKAMRKQLDIGQERVDAMRKQLAQTEAALAAVSRQAAHADRTASQVKSVLRLNDAHTPLLAGLDGVLDGPRVADHVRQAIEGATIDTVPYPHIVVENLFPADFYATLRKAIPPASFFGDVDPIKQNLRTPLEFGPELSIRVLGFLEDVIVKGTLPGALTRKFHESLRLHYDAIFGPALRDRATAMAQSVTGGRLMLRRPGYHLAPHRDPKRSMLTCLMYFAGGKDSEEYGTDLFRVADDREATYTQTYYPEQNGSICELVKRVPFRPNTMLVFLNSTGAHGATIPDDAPSGLERFSYQCYIGPSHDALAGLIRELPPERQLMWRSKSEVEAPAS
jgi:hypothetical protein